MDTYVRPEAETRPEIEHFDVLIVGAGLSGIGAAWHLQKNCPGRSYTILEGREASGGTWDLFRYPGVRSDSDMYTLGYRFRPWKDAKAIADGPSILSYIREVASDNGIDGRIRYQHKVVSASWSTPESRWTVEAERGPGRTAVRFTCNFLWMCSGYYRTESGYLPDFPGMANFKGTLVHPQKWPKDLDYRDKKVVVIGSGATAVTLVPAMADNGAAHVTMLQRSPTYMAVRPSQDPFATKMRARLPLKLAYMVTRWKNVLMGMYFYQMCKRKPDKVKGLLSEFSATNPNFSGMQQQKDWQMVQDLVKLLEIFQDRKVELLSGDNPHKQRKSIRDHAEALVTRASLLEQAALRLAGTGTPKS